MKAAESRMADDRGIAVRLRGGRSHRRRAFAQPRCVLSSGPYATNSRSYWMILAPGGCSVTRT